MPDDKRRFALRENGKETSVFKAEMPRQAALKAARQLDPAENKKEAIADSERLQLREHGTDKVRIYQAYAWKENAPDDSPEWIKDSVTRGDVRRTGTAHISDSERESLSSESELRRISTEPHEYTQVKQEKCDRCGNSLDTVRTAACVYTVTSPEINTYKRYYYDCENCDDTISAKSQDITQRSQYGKNILAQSVLFHFAHRIPYRKVGELLGQLYGPEFELNQGGVYGLIELMYEVARPEYEEIRSRIQSAEVLHIDETSHLVDSSNSWLWGFTTGDETLYALRDSRGSEVLEEILGEEFDGIIVCDGHTAYPAFHSRLQRCWGHLLRGTDSLSEGDDEAWAIYNELHEIYDDLQSFLDTEPTLTKRKAKIEKTREELRDLTATEVESQDAIDELKMLHNGIPHWLTFVGHPDVDATNNRIEALLREPIKIRRIIGQLQNKKGMRHHETFLSLIQTWKQQHKNPYSELQRLAQQV